MSLIKSYQGYGPQGKLAHTEKVTIERLDEKGETNIKSRIEYHYTYDIDNYGGHHRINRSIIFICSDEPKIEKVNILIKNIMKSIYKFIKVEEYKHFEHKQFEQIIKDSVNYTAFKYSFLPGYAGHRNGRHMISL